MTTIQIELTDFCPNECSNCTRLCHHKKPFFMSFEQFKDAIDSLIGIPDTCLVGFMGGEPLFHPEFEKFCKYAVTKFKPEQLGLWTCLPKGKEHYREVIVNTFGNVFINDHTRNDIMHAPLLVSASEINCLNDNQKWQLIDNCFCQEQWSASINPHGAFFCELAASLSMLLSDESDGWKVESGWWWRTPKDYVSQMEKYCMTCGFAMPLKKRISTEDIDDISPKMYERLKDTSPKIKAGKYKIHDLQLHRDNVDLCNQSYKDDSYRQTIAKRYGIFLSVNERRYNSPHLFRNWKKEQE